MESIILAGSIVVVSATILLYTVIKGGPEALNKCPEDIDRNISLRRTFFQQIGIALGSFTIFIAGLAYLIPRVVEILKQ